MSAPHAAMARFFGNTLGAMDYALGHPPANPNLWSVGEDMGDEDEVMAEAMGLVEAGWHPVKAMQHARQRHAMRRAQRHGGGGGGSIYRVFGPRGQMGWDPNLEGLAGFDDDDEDDELGRADDEEIEALGADDEEVGDDEEGAEVLGANATHVKQRIMKLEAKLKELEAEYRATPSFKVHRRKHLMRRINRVKMHLAKKERKLNKKLDKLKSKFGYVPNLHGMDPGLQQGMAQLANLPGSGFYPTSRPQGTEQSIPLRFGGALWLDCGYTAGEALGSSVTISGTTNQINFADLEMTALQISVQQVWERPTPQAPGDSYLGPSNSQVIIVDLSTLIGSGSVNAFYDNQVLPGAGRVLAFSQTEQQQTAVYRLDGLRQDTIIEKNGTATLTGGVTIARSPETAGRVIVSASLIVQTIRDTVVGRSYR